MVSQQSLHFALSLLFLGRSFALSLPYLQGDFIFNIPMDLGVFCAAARNVLNFHVSAELTSLVLNSNCYQLSTARIIEIRNLKIAHNDKRIVYRKVHCTYAEALDRPNHTPFVHLIKTKPESCIIHVKLLLKNQSLCWTVMAPRISNRKKKNTLRASPVFNWKNNAFE